METKVNREKEYAIALGGLVVLAAAGILLGWLIGSPNTGGSFQIIMPVALGVLVLFGLVAYIVAHRPLQALVQSDLDRQKAASSDPLTGLLNREHILSLLDRELNRAWRGGEIIACGLIDVDKMEQLNKKFGHAAGDGLLRSGGNVVAETCRQYDSAGRYSGAGFLVVLPGTELDDAARAAERLRQRIEASEFAFDGQGIHITVSAGVTQIDAETIEKMDDVLRRAETALNRAKEEGRNRVCATAPPSVVTSK